MRAVRIVTAILLALVGLVGLAPDGHAAPGQAAGGVQGKIVDFSYELPTPTVTAGDTITWTNNGNRPHTVTDRGGLFDTGAVLPAAQSTITLDVPGTYFFFCEINPSKMNGTVVVEPAAETPTEVRIQAIDEARDNAPKHFDPPALEVATGTRLILANVGGLPHSLVAEDGSFSTDVVQPGAEQGRFSGGNASVVVTKPGTYSFFCEIHPAAMKGTLTVTGERVEADDRASPEVEPPPSTADVSAFEFGYDEADAIVAPGGKVTWTNAGQKPHTATFDDIQLDTGRIEPDGEAVLTAPTQPGSYSYFCSVHPTQMRGVLVVPAEITATADDGKPDTETAAPPAAAVDKETDGTALAYVIAVLVLGVGVVGLYFGLRRRPA